MFKFKFKILFSFLLFFLIFSLLYNKYVLPVVINVTEKYAVTEVNKEINKAYNNIIAKRNITQSDFTNEQNSNQFLNTNTVIVNSICSEMAEVLSERLNNIEDKRVKIPLGLFSTLNFLSTKGPALNMSVNSMGEAKADYESSFKSCGVNQINYKLWLNVETEVSVINPLVHKNIVVKRKIAVIDMVYNGGVPDAYVNVDRNK